MILFYLYYRNTPEWPDYFHLTKYPVKSPKLTKNANSSTSGQVENNNHKYDKPVKYDADEVKVLIERSKEKAVGDFSVSDIYPTSFCNQFSTLFWRNFANARRRILFPISVIQNLYILVICILVWWQPERTEETVKDRLGLVCFTLNISRFRLLLGIMPY